MDSHKTLTALFISNHLEMVFVKGGTFTMGCTPEQGNVCEWVSDELKPYTAAAQINPNNSTPYYMGNAHILRGGSWTRTAKESRNSYRHQDHESDTRIDSGLRLVLPVTAAP